MESTLDGLFLQERLAELERSTQHDQLVTDAIRTGPAVPARHQDAGPRLWLGSWLRHLGQACTTVGGRWQI